MCEYLFRICCKSRNEKTGKYNTFFTENELFKFVSWLIKINMQLIQRNSRSLELTETIHVILIEFLLKNQSDIKYNDLNLK